MKSNSAVCLSAILLLTLFFFCSCNKKEDVAFTNLMLYRHENTQSQLLDITTISTNLVLEDRVNGVDYIVSHTIELNANLTIKPGVTLMFEEGAGLQVNAQGSITAIGASGNLILFTSKSNKRAAWNGIAILSNSAKNILSYCKIEQGGAVNIFGSANVSIGSGSNAAQAEINNCEITASDKDGLFISEGSRVKEFYNNRIHTNSAFPISMHVADAVNMDNMNQFSNNGKEFIQLTGNGLDRINKGINLRKLNESFLISGKITVGYKLNIAAGSRVYMDNEAEIVVDGLTGQGTFSAVGALAQPIFITGIYNGTGIWNRICFLSSNSADNHIEYCTISGGGLKDGSNEDGMISVVNGEGGSSNLVIRNCNINNSAALGIYIQRIHTEYNSDIITSNTFLNNIKGKVHIE